MKTLSFRYVIAVVFLGFALPLHAQLLQWERFPIADSLYNVKVLGLTKTRFGIFTNAISDSLLFTYDRGRSWQKARWKDLGDTAFFPGTQDIPRALGFQETTMKLFTIVSWGYICFSTDSGKTWQAMRGSLSNKPTNDFLIVTKLIVRDTLLFVLRDNAIYRSNDDGKTWKYLNVYESIGFFPGLIEDIEIDNGMLILFTAERRRIISSDNGESWKLNPGIPLPAKVEETTLKRLDNNLFFAQQRIIQKGDVTFNHWLSRDSGKTWQTFSLLGSKDYTADYIVVGSTLFFATTQGIFTTRDKGETWQKESGIGTLPDGKFAFFMLDGNTLYAAVYEKGVYRADVSTITSVGSAYNQGFMVYAIAPNPIVSGNAELRFILPQIAEVHAVLYNALGQPVKEVLRERIQQGEHVSTFSVQELPSGAYTCHITAGNHTVRQTILIVK